MIEPDPFNIISGKLNFRLNRRNGNFYNFYIGENNITRNPPSVSVDYFVEREQIDFVDLLHSDIQGFELDMLKGATELFKQERIGYVFISTHSNDIHNACIEWLKLYNYIIVAAANLDETYSLDGLIVAKKKDYPAPDKIDISKRKVHA